MAGRGRINSVAGRNPQPAHRGSSFALSFLLLPGPKRAAIRQVYAFCRALDDVSDDVNPIEEKKRRLAFWREELGRCYAGKATQPVGKALQEAIREFQLTRTHFEELLQGIEMDLTISRYENFVHLSQYCYRVAGTIGLLCLEIFGCPDSDSRDYAIALGLAFQITNILRDVKEDAGRGRIYLPMDELRRFGYTESELMAHTYNEPFIQLMSYQAARAEDYFQRASELLKPEYRRRLIASEIMATVYFALLQRIKASRFQVFDRPIRLSRPYKITLALRAALMNRMGIGRVVSA